MSQGCRTRFRAGVRELAGVCAGGEKNPGTSSLSEEGEDGGSLWGLQARVQAGLLSKQGLVLCWFPAGSPCIHSALAGRLPPPVCGGLASLLFM